MIQKQRPFLFILMLCLSGCFADFTAEQIAETSHSVGQYEVVETIYREGGFPDDTFERVIVVKDGRATTSIGIYRDESQIGVTVAPELVEGWVVIYSSAHLFLWQPDEDVRHFNPYQAAGWQTYSDQFKPSGLNGHYDYRAARFWLEDERWFIQYECTYCQDNTPALLLFTSDDEGETYALEK
jgi:hypothetical protein